MTRTFSDLHVPRDLVAVLRRSGIDTPTAIQAATIPPALEGRDLCGRAPTGSGKTLAFAVPIAARIERARPHRPRALVLTPTRELASQVQASVAPLAATRSLRVVCFYGGTNIRRDLVRLRKGVDIAVATPGRLADLIQRGEMDLTDVDLVVVDEADRMADMGFLPEVRRILDRTSPTRQTLLFSATLDGDVDVLVRHYQRHPIRHEVDAPPTAAGDVRHLFWSVGRQDRRRVTSEIVQAVSPAIVFTRTKRGADRLAKALSADGRSTAAIHGNRSQRQREDALRRFADGRVDVLVATDVAARGIHVDAVALIVHFDLPATTKDFVHRSGRTGRAGATGTVVTLVPHDQRQDAIDLQRQVGAGGVLGDVDLAALVAGTPTVVVQDRVDVTAHGSEQGEGGRGTVKWFRPERGYGFIAPDDGGADLFVHHTGILGSGLRSLEDGQRVRFAVVPGRKGPEAAEVRAN